MPSIKLATILVVLFGLIACVETPKTVAPSQDPDNPTNAVPPAKAGQVVTYPRVDPKKPFRKLSVPRGVEKTPQDRIVFMTVTIDARGKVIAAVIAQSSGSDILDKAAKNEALDHWRFLPGLVDGVPTQMDIKFRAVVDGTAHKQ